MTLVTLTRKILTIFTVIILFNCHLTVCQLSSLFGTGFLGSHRPLQNRQVTTTPDYNGYNISSPNRQSIFQFDSGSNVTSLTDLEDPLYCSALTWNYGWIAVATNAFASCKLKTKRYF